MKTRRATRSFTEEPVAHELLVRLMESARWAPSAGNRRIHKFVVIEDLPTIHLIHAFAPGMLSNPTALIIICTDKIKAAAEGVKLAVDSTTWVDVGAAAQNIMLTALELGLGSCPTTSFSHSGVRSVLNLPDHLEPEYIVQLGHPVPETTDALRGVHKTDR
ncbi:MAG: nitroreductase family protein [Anaerolineae bacterium]